MTTIAFQFHDFALLRRLVADERELPGLILPSGIDFWDAEKPDLSAPLLPRARRLAGENLVSIGQTVRDPEALFTQRVVPLLDEAQVGELRGRKKDDPISPGLTTLRLTLIRLGNEVEISANDQPLLRLPTEPACVDVDCLIKTVGMAVAIKDMTLRPIGGASTDPGGTTVELPKKTPPEMNSGGAFNWIPVSRLRRLSERVSLRGLSSPVR